MAFIPKKFRMPLLGGILVIATLVTILFAVNNRGDNTSNTTAKPAKAVQYSDATTNLSITPPAGWVRVMPTPQGDIVDFQAAQTDKDSSGQSRPRLSVLKAEAHGTLGQYIQAIQALNTKNLQGYRDYGSRQVTVDGTPATILNYSANVHGNMLRTAEMVSIKGSTLYGVTGIALASFWDKYEGNFTSTFFSLKLP